MRAWSRDVRTTPTPIQHKGRDLWLVTRTATFGYGLILCLVVLNALVSFINTWRWHENDKWITHARQVLSEDAENSLLVERTRETRNSYLISQIANVAAALLTIAAIVLSSFMIAREKRIRRCAEADAHQQREWCLTCLRSIGDAVIITDARGRVMLMNPVAHELTGWGEEALGRELAEVFPIINELDRKPAESPVAKVLREGTVAGLANHTTLIAKNGREIPIDDSAAPIRDRRNQISGVMLVFRDIRARRESEQARHREDAALRQAARRKDEFLAMLAHELRNPLAPISNAVQIMRMEGPSGANYHWSIEVIEAQVKQMARMVDDLLDVSRITRGKVKLVRENVDVATVVDQAVLACRPEIDDRKQDLTVSVPSDALMLEADPVRLTQVLGNLLHNASKYTSEGGKLALTVEKAGENEVVITVKDTGIGIAKEMLPKVFDLFTQAEQSLDRSQGGLGIGLTLVRHLVEQHGGSVSAHSEGLGRGSEFVVRLPLATEGQGAALARKDIEPATSGPELRRILVVDDNQDSARSLGVLLQAAGHDVQTAIDGVAALEITRSWRPEIVLLDIGLPGMDGYEVARRIRQGPDINAVLLVAISGYGTEENKKRAQQAGFDAYLIKPVDMKALEEIISRSS
jgi:PAS domain S-box-containing protein